MIINLPNILYTVTFDASAKTVVINGLGDVYAGNIKKIVNTTDNIVIYDDNDIHKLGTITSNSINQTLTVVLDYNTTSMDDADSIVVTYNAEDDVLIFDALTAQSVYNYSSSLNNNLNQIDVFLIAGQSNALGRGDSALSPVPQSGSVYQFYLSTISEGIDPIGGANSGSAWPSFGIRYYNTTGRKVCFVPSAVGGSSMSPGEQPTNLRWDTGGTLYGTSVVRLNNGITALSDAGYTPIIRGILWCQGEQDGSDINNILSTAQEYKTNFTSMSVNYRSEFGSHLPIYIFRTGTNTGVSDTGYAAVRLAQEELATSLTDVYIVYRGAVDFPSRGLLSGSVHYTQEGYNEMGTYGAEVVCNRYAANNPISQYVKTGFGVKSPLAYIDIAPNSSSIPVMRFGTDGVLLTSPMPGAFESTNAALYYTDSGSNRRQLATLTGTETITNKTLGSNLAFSTDATYSIGSSGNQAVAIWCAALRNNGNIQIRTSNASNLIQFLQNTEVSRFSTNGNLLISTTTDAAAADKLQINGNLNLITSGNKIKIATGSNASVGTSTLSSGTVTVSTTAVAAGSKLFTQLNTPAGTLGIHYSVPNASIVAGTSFVINAVSSAGTVVTTDTSTINWWIIN